MATPTDNPVITERHDDPVCNAASTACAHEVYAPTRIAAADQPNDRVVQPTDNIATDKTQGLTPGEHTLQLAVDGQNREYKIYVPQNAQHPLPVVFAADGVSRDGSDPGYKMGVVNRLYEDADKHGYAVVSLFPDTRLHPLPGLAPTLDSWNFPNAVTGFHSWFNQDDTDYFHAVQKDISQHIQADPSRQFCEGFSEGAQFFHYLDEQGQSGLSCQKEALFSGTVTTQEPPDKPGVPELIVLGKNDNNLPLDGQVHGFQLNYFNTIEGGNLDHSAPMQLFGRAVSANGANPNDAATTHTQYFDKRTVLAPNGVRTTEYVINPPYGGHSFPGRKTGAPYESPDSQKNGTPAPHTVFDGPHVAACFFGLEQGQSCNSEGTP